MPKSPEISKSVLSQFDTVLEIDKEGKYVGSFENREGKFHSHLAPVPGQPLDHIFGESFSPNRSGSNEEHFSRVIRSKSPDQCFYFTKSKTGENLSFYVSLNLEESTNKRLLFIHLIPLQTIISAKDDLNLAVSDQIHESEEKFRKTFYNSAIGIALVSTTGNWLEVNAAIPKMLGYTDEELKSLTFQDITHPEDLNGDLELLNQTLAGEINSYRLEKRYIHKDGKTVHALLSVALVRSSSGEAKFFVSQLIDITQTKFLIQDLERKNLLLEATSSDLEKKIDQLQEFNRIVAHNLRASIGNVVSLVAFLKDKNLSPDPEEVIGLLEESSKAVLENLENLQKVIEVRANRGVEFEELQIDQVMQSVLKTLSGKIKTSHAKIQIDFQIKNLLYPRVYLESILFNLLDNSLKYTKPGIPPEITVTTLKKNDKTYLSVKDNGIGINLKLYGDQIFKYKKVFHRGFDSNGVGLFMTKNQIETFGGSIQVESKPHEGSIFTVAFV
ncbi:sensor histidine kinase [Leptospira idonii]|uniref:histidine kinase n=1 Tax=Leptospira idonii TaxID=1193500 RepID=A0A4V3JY23_9LEPT|nr:HAMP domain-containing sensor histidine kinase [Leptospira idonii]TGN19686.1 PAS domain S-box protein [Leptospira idonii]